MMAIAGSTVPAFSVQMRDGAPMANGATLHVHPSVAYSDILTVRKGTLDEAIALLQQGQAVTVAATRMEFVELCRRMGHDGFRQECHQ